MGLLRWGARLPVPVVAVVVAVVAVLLLFRGVGVLLKIKPLLAL